MNLALASFPVELPWLMDLPVIAPFWAGYAAILIVPGPTNLMIAATTATCGFRATLALRCAIAVGAATQALAISQLIALTPYKGELAAIMPVLSAILLLCIAWRMATLRPVTTVTQPPRRHADVIFGFLCGFTNVITASFFAAQFLYAPSPKVQGMDLGRSLDAAFEPALLGAGVIAFSLISTTTTALLFGLPSIRQWVIRRMAAIRWSVCALFCGASFVSLMT